MKTTTPKTARKRAKAKTEPAATPAKPPAKSEMVLVDVLATGNVIGGEARKANEQVSVSAEEAGFAIERGLARKALADVTTGELVVIEVITASFAGKPGLLMARGATFKGTEGFADNFPNELKVIGLAG